MPSATSAECCGQTWSDPNIPHLCSLVMENEELVKNSKLTAGKPNEKLPSLDKKAGKSQRKDKRNSTKLQQQENTKSGTSIETAENIQVFVRIRPIVDREKLIEQSNSNLYIRPTSDQCIEVRTTESNFKCKYDAVFDSTFTQEQVYHKVKECTEAVLNGFNSTLFAYGQTGSGKSYTMFGNENSATKFRPGLTSSEAGIIPRAIKDIFAGLAKDQCDSAVFCSFVQVYNENIYDLFRDSNMNTPLTLHEDRKNGIYVEGLSEFAVRGVNDCLNLLESGEENRAVRATHMNQASSRSHSVFQLLVEKKNNNKNGSVIRSKFNLVDLAGSEKWNIGAELKVDHISEMTNINLSLHTLGRCIGSLSSKSKDKQAVHVPYRDSKLTRLLQDSLGGNTKTRIIATLSPSIDCIEESISTLKFADRAKQVMVVVKINEHRDIDPAYVENLEREVENLRALVQTYQLSTPEINNADENPDAGNSQESNLKTKILQLTQENNQLKQERKIPDKNNAHPQHTYSSTEIETLRRKTENLEEIVHSFKDATDRFFRFEIEEDDLKEAISSSMKNLSKFTPQPPKSIPKLTMPGIHGKLSKVKQKLNNTSFRVRGKSGMDSCTWQNNSEENDQNQADRELILAKKEMKKQQKLQEWLMEKEKRELLKMRQEQEYIEEQRKLMAEKDAKFFRRAKSIKVKLIKNS